MENVAIPQPGQIVRVRTRTYLVEYVEANNGGRPADSIVSLACIDDDAQADL